MAPVASSTYIALRTFTTGATGADETVREGDRLIGNHAITVAHENYFILDGASADQIQAAKNALAAAGL